MGARLITIPVDMARREACGLFPDSAIARRSYTSSVVCRKETEPATSRIGLIRWILYL